MFQAILIIWSIATLLVVIGVLPYAVWLGFMAWRRQWRKLILRAAIPLVSYSLITSAVFLSGYIHQKLYFDTIFDTKAGLGKPLFEYDSPRAFNGDGYSLTVYGLSPAIRKRFENPDARLLSQFPKFPSERSQWAMEPWRQAPVETRFRKHVDFALSSYDQDQNPHLRDHFSAIESSLAGDSAYYAFFWFNHGDNVGDIDFFLVDLKGGLIYVINHNT